MHTPRIFDNQKYLLFIINFFQSYINTATLNLLTSSILVSISGAFRVYIASLLLGTHVTPLVCVAGGLVIYSVYTLDRALDSEEDLINRKELCGSCKEMGFAASILSFIVGGYFLSIEGLLWLAFVPIVTGFLYSKGIKIGKHSLKLKGGLGIKNLVVGISWGVFITGLACTTCKHLISIIVIFILYGVKVFINSAIDDFKDVKGDTIAGIQTLPVKLGEFIGIEADLLAQYGAVSGETARAMASQTAQRLGCDIAVSATGIA
ncbi:MAG: UbiA family prenyltransferase, partial [Acholeplasmataceae bacterium]|nr:UbiA family prenyltransferase [Acholeplasmataceae bacterium]